MIIFMLIAIMYIYYTFVSSLLLRSTLFKRNWNQAIRHEESSTRTEIKKQSEICKKVNFHCPFWPFPVIVIGICTWRHVDTTFMVSSYRHNASSLRKEPWMRRVSWKIHGPWFKESQEKNEEKSDLKADSTFRFELVDSRSCTFRELFFSLIEFF